MQYIFMLGISLFTVLNQPDFMRFNHQTTHLSLRIPLALSEPIIRQISRCKGEDGLVYKIDDLFIHRPIPTQQSAYRRR